DLMVEIVSRTAGKAQFKYCENIDEAAFDVSFPGFYTPKKDPAVFMADYTRSPGVFSFSENLFFDHPNPSQPFDSTDPIPYYVRGPDADLTLKVKIQLEKKNFGKTIRSGNLFLMPVAFNLAMWKEAKDRRSRFVGAPLMGYAIYGTTPGAYAGPVPLAFGTRKNTGDKEGPGLDPDAPKSLNPAHPKVAQLIKEWISVAEPPSNATHGNNFHFSNQGVAIGQGKGFTAESRHESGQFDPVFLWKYKRRLDSVNHCTLEEYVIAKLKNLSIEHCKGRYRAGDDQHSPNEPPPEAGLIIPNLIGKKASEAKATLIDKGFKVTLLAGKPAPTHEQAFTVTHTRPQPGTVQKKGETVEITVFVDYAPTVKIPAVAGLTTVEARKRLQDAGFNVSLKTRGNSPDPDTAFKAMGTDPKVDMAVPKGSTITLISFGPYKERVEMPLLLGLKISQAELELEKLGLEVYSSPGDAASTKQDEGLVTAQDPAAGKTVSPRSKIKLTYYDKYVWEGSMPDLTGLTVEKAKKILEANKVRIYANSGIPASATLQVNTIYKQSLPKNSAVREGDYVTVTIYSKTKEQWVAATDCLKYPGTEAFWNEKTNTTGCRCKTGYVLRNDKSGCDKKAEPTPLPAVVKHPAKTQEPVKPSIPVNTGSKTTPPTENNTEPNEIQLSATACERIKNPGMPIDKATRDRTADETKSAFKHLFTPIFTSIYGERSQDPWKMQVLYRTHKNSTRTVTAIHVQVQYKTTPKDYQTEEAISLGFYFNDVDPSAAEYDAAAFIKKVKSYKGEIQSLDGMPVYANPDRRTWTWATPDTRMLIVVRGVDKNKDYLDFAKKVHQHLKTRGLYDIRSKLPCW
ncbi:MAG: PASTA domain-containing protein, partial [Proteobacteria bacterium]|nr:PASTA domain-containing protein [Pseudomonadota bacterium]